MTLAYLWNVSQWNERVNELYEETYFSAKEREVEGERGGEKRNNNDGNDELRHEDIS